MSILIGPTNWFIKLLSQHQNLNYTISKKIATFWTVNFVLNFLLSVFLDLLVSNQLCINFVVFWHIYLWKVWRHQFLSFYYCKIASSNTSCLGAHVGFCRLLMKGNPVLMYCNLLTKSWLLMRIRTQDFTVCLVLSTIFKIGKGLNY